MDLIKQSQKSLKQIEGKYQSDSYQNESEWKEDITFIKGRIEGYKRILELVNTK